MPLLEIWNRSSGMRLRHLRTVISVRIALVGALICSIFRPLLESGEGVGDEEYSLFRWLPWSAAGTCHLSATKDLGCSRCDVNFRCLLILSCGRVVPVANFDSRSDCGVRVRCRESSVTIMSPYLPLFESSHSWCVSVPFPAALELMR